MSENARKPVHASGTVNSARPLLRRRISSVELFGPAQEIVIEHAGAEYRLRLTSQGKLILNK